MIVVHLLMLAGGCGAAGGGGGGAAEPAGSPPGRLEVVAHRGASGSRPENTMAAFRRAAELGADRVELDVQLAADGGLVVFHDETLERTTDGQGRIRDHATEALRGLDAGSWFGPAFGGEPIPTLDEVLDWSVGRMPLNVELKVVGDEEHARRLARAVVSRLEARGAAAGTVLSSFDRAALAEAARLGSGAQVALLWSGRDRLDPLGLLEAAGARALHVSLRGLSAELVRRARGRGVPVRVYTVNDREELDLAVAAGADAVFTDHPDRVLGWLGR